MRFSKQTVFGLRTVLWFFMYAAVCIPAAAQEAWVDTTEHAATRAKWTVIPILFSSPDTRIGLGAVPHFVFHTAEKTRASSAKLEASYTQNRQFNLRASSSLWLPGNVYAVDMRIQFQDWPSSFYGIGNNVPRDRKEGYSSRIMLATAEFQREVAPRLYVGFRQDVRRDEIESVQAGGLLDVGGIEGSGGGLSVGMGGFLSFDSRDFVTYPTDGFLLRAGMRLFAKPWGSHWNFARHRVEARAYTHFARQRVLAGQVVAAFASGTPPFQMFSSVGEILRGYGSSRYIDRNLLAARVEYRHTPVIWRFGYALFVGAGGVAPALEAFDVSKFHVSAGVGLRFQVIPSERVNLRWDFAVGTRTTATYLDVGEAF